MKKKRPLPHSAGPPVFAGPAYELSMNLLERERIRDRFERELLQRHLDFNVVLVFPPSGPTATRTNLNTKREAARAAALAQQRALPRTGD